MTVHQFPGPAPANRQPAPSRPAGDTCPGDPPSPGQGLADSGMLAALKRISPLAARADWTDFLINTLESQMPRPMPPDLPDDHDPRYLKVRTGGNLHLSWWQRQAPVDRALLTMVAAACVAGLALIVWQVWP